MFPLWGSVLLLAITRIKHLKIKGLLTCDEPSFNLELGSFAKFRLGPACVICLKDIYGTTQSWCLKALFVPAIIPFFVISLLCIFIFKLDRKTTAKIWNDTWHRLKMPIVALMGALAMVNLLMVGGKDSCTAIIGRTFAEIAGKNWQYCASFLGAVGSFFAGSNTVSNLTFGGIQESIAQSLNLDLTTILALQSVGGAMGNMVCINNIVAVCSILGVMAKEGYILKRTVLPMIIYGIIASIISAFL
jgi:lactate permease